MMLISRENILGLVLAGGSSQRMQSIAITSNGTGPVDKCLLDWQGQPLIYHIIKRAEPQVDRLIISSNSSDVRFSKLGKTVLADDTDCKQLGPLSGILRALRWIKQEKQSYQWLATFPADTPLLPSDLISRLVASLENHTNRDNLRIISLQNRSRKQPLFSLWSLDCLPALEIFLANGGRKVMQFIEEQPHHYEEVNEKEYALNNINTPEDWQKLSTD